MLARCKAVLVPNDEFIFYHLFLFKNVVQLKFMY